MRKTITASVQKEGFEAILYPGNGRKDKVMIVMSGERRYDTHETGSGILSPKRHPFAGAGAF